MAREMLEFDFPPREKIENFVTNVTRNFCLKIEEFFTLVNINFSTSTRIKKDRIVKSGTHIKSNIGNLKDFFNKSSPSFKMGPCIFHASSCSLANEERNSDSNEATSGGNRIIR